jgi:AraC-like DNA-binding protein
MVSLLRSASAHNYPEVARSVGLDPLPLLRAVHVSPLDLENPDTRVPLEPLLKLLEMTAEQSGVEDIGLRMAETRRLSDFGPLGLLGYVEATVRDALQSIFRYMPAHTSAFEVSLQEAGGIAVIRGGFNPIPNQPYRQGIEQSLGVIYRLLHQILGDGWRPRRISFAHSAPKVLSRYQKLFRVPVDFDAEFDGIILDSKDLDRPIASADPVMAAYLHRQLETLIGASSADLGNQVRHAISELLPSGRCSSANVARKLGLSQPTFFRRMAKQRVNYRAILNTLRQELARHYMRNDARPIKEVADLLGFPCPSAYTRWFKQAYGCSPREWRKTQSAA